MLSSVLAAGLLATSAALAGPIDRPDTAALGAREFVDLTRRSNENVSRSHGDDDWVLEHHLGNLSPYWSPPSEYSTELPKGCVVDQVSLMQRHGSRFPLASELVYIQNVSTLFATNPDKLKHLTGKYEFLKTWQNQLGHDDLSPVGREQLFSNGVALKLAYPQLNNSVLLAGDQDRVVESAQWFQMGYFGRNWANVSNLETIPEDKVTYSYITPMNNCSLWSYPYGLIAVNAWNEVYLPPIQKRINKEIPGFNFTENNIHGMLYSCAYELASYGSTPWCALFKKDEITNFEYELDLLMNYAFGYGLPYKLAVPLGSLYVNVLIDRLTGASNTKTDLWQEFGHDTTIDLALSALGLAKDTPNIPAKGPVNPDRAWRTSTQVPFGAKLITERITCPATKTNGTTESWVRLLLNDAPLPITTCGSKMDKKTGACPLDTFVAKYANVRNITHSDYDRVCNNTGTITKASF